MRSMPRSVRRMMALSAAAAAALAPAASLMAAGINPYTGGGTGTAATPVTGNFSNGFTSSPSAGGSASLELDFSNSGTNTYVATDDLAGALSLNILQFGTDSTSGGTAATIAAGTGNSLNFVSNGATTPTITQNGSSVFTVSAPVTATNALSLNAASGLTSSTAGAVTFSGTFANAGGLTVTGGNYTLSGVVSGAGTLTVNGGGSLSLTGTANTFTTTTVGVDGAGSNLTLQSGGSFGLAPGTTAAGNPANRTLTLTNGGQLTINTSYDLNVINGNFPIISIGAGGGVLNQAAGATLVLNDASEFVGATNAPLLKTGAGNTQLNQSYTFTGAITVNQGTLEISNAAGAGTASSIIVAPSTGTVVGTAGAVLNVDNGITFARPISLGSTGIANAGGLINGSGGNTSTLTGGITLTANSAIGGAGNLSITTAGIGGTGFTLNKVGAGLVSLGAPNTYTGATTVSGGTLRVTAAANLPPGNIALNGGVLEPGYNYTSTLGTGNGQVQLPGGASGFSAGASPVTVSLNSGATLQWGSALFNPSTLVVNQTTAAGVLNFQNPIDLNGAVRTFAGNNASAGIVNGVISNSSATTSGVTVNGSGLLVFAAANTYTGTTTLTAGTLSISADNNLSTGTPISFNGGTLQVTGTTLNNFGSHTATFVAGKTIGLDINTAGNTFTVPASNALVAGQTLTKVGAGTLVLSAATNTVTTLNMNGGTLDIGTGTLNISNNGSTTIRGTANSTLNATGGGKIVLSANGASTTDFADNSVASGVTLTINAKVSGAVATAGFEYCCDNPGGTIVLNNTGNDFSGNVFMNSAGTISVPAIGLAGNVGPLGKGNTITLNGLSGTTGARLLYTGTGETTDRIIALSQTVDVLEQGGTGLLKFSTAFQAPGTNVKTLTLQGSTTGIGEIAGAIPDNTTTNTTSVSKAGTGTWVLSGNNTFTGTLNVTAGALQLSANAGNTTSGVSSAAGAEKTGHLSISNGASLLLRSDSSVTFAGTSGIGALNNATVGIDVNQLTGAGSNGVLTISASAPTPIGNAVNINVTGGNGYSLTVGTIDNITGAATNLTLNPTTASVTLGTSTTAAGGSYFNYNNAANNSTLTLSGTTTGNVVSGVIANQGTVGGTASTGTGIVALTKSGTSTWTLGGTNTYTGATTINGGVLRVTGSLASGTATTINVGGGLGGTGTVSGAVTASATGGNIDLRDGAVGTLTLGSTLTLNGASATPNNLYFDLGSGSTDQIVATGVVAVPNAGGAVINLNQLAGTPLTPTTYTLITGASGSAGNSQYTLATTAAGGNTFQLQSTTNGSGQVLEQIAVTAGVVGPASTYWSGAVNNTWTTAGNWNTDATSNTPTGAAPGIGSNVVFHTTTPAATNLATTLGADFEINSLSFAAGTSTVSIGGTNTLTIDAGTSGGNASGNGISDLAEGITDTISAKVGLGASQTWAVGPASGSSTASLVVSGAVSDFGGKFGLTKAGTGTLTLSGPLNYTGPTVVTAGTLLVTNVGTGASANVQSGAYTVQSNATLRAAATAGSGLTSADALGTAPVTLNNGTSLLLNPVDTSTATGLFYRRFATNVGNTSGGNFTQAATGTGTVTALTGSNIFTSSAPESEEFTGKLNVTTTGSYTFGLNADDGARLFIDGQLAVNNDTGAGKGQGTTISGQPVSLSSGFHDIRLQFTNNSGSGGVQLVYTGPGLGGATGNQTAVTVPFAAFFQPSVTNGNSFVTLPNAVTMPNSVTVTSGATSTIDLGSTNLATQSFVGVLLSPATGTALTLNTGSTLNVTGAAANTGTSPLSTLNPTATLDAGRFLASASTSLAGGGTINLVTNGDFYAGTLTDNGTAVTLVKSGTGQLVLDPALGNNSLVSGSFIQVNAGRLHLYGAGTTNPLGSATVVLGGAGADIALDTHNGAPTFDNPLVVSASGKIEDFNGAITTTLGGVNGVSVGTGATLTLDATAGTPQGGTAGATLSLAGAISGAGSLNIISTSYANSATQPGLVVLSNPGNNSFSGGVTLTSGSLQANGSATATPGALGTGTVTIATPATGEPTALFLKSNGVANNGTITFNGSGTPNPVAITGTGSTTIDVNNVSANTGNTITLGTLSMSAATLNVTGGNGYNLAFNGATTLTGNATFSPSTANLLLSGPVGGAFTLAKTGTGTLILGANGNGYTTTTITAGTLQVGNGGTTGSLGSGAVTVTGATLAFNFLAGASPSFSNVISGTGAVTQIGAGTTTLTGNNTYAGTTTVTAGVLKVNGTTSGQGAYSIASGATLAGTGTIGLSGTNIVTVASGGTLAPGSGTAPGNLTINGPASGTASVVTLAPGSNFQVFLTHTAGSELLVSNGNITLTNANLVLQQDGSLQGGETYTIIDPPGSITGPFASGTSGTSNGISYTLAYNPTTVQLTVTNVVPEPASLGLLGAGALGLLARRRRRIAR